MRQIELKTEIRIMSHEVTRTNAVPAIRIADANPDHHLWNNNGTWFVHYVVHPTPITKERVRRSLGTKCLSEARARRDALLAGRD